MSIFLAGRSALEYRKRYLVDNDAHAYAVAFRHSAPSSAEIRAALKGVLSVLDAPLEIVLPGCSPDRRANINSYVIRRYWSCGLSSRAFTAIDEGAQIYVSSPGFAFAQLAAKHQLVELISLGCEICGRYFISTSDPAGFFSGDRLLAPTSLRGAALSMSGYRGRDKAARAARYVVADAASPRETALVLLLCLPCRIGGYGLPYPQMNATIKPSNAMVWRVSQHSFVCDLYWKDAKLDVEYDGDAFHVGAEKIARDARRRSELAMLGVQSITVTNYQLKSRAETDKVAHTIARKLGVRIREDRTIDWDSRHRALRRELLANDWVGGPG